MVAKNQLIFALLFVLLLFPLVSSDNLGTFKQYDNVTVRANLEASFVNVTVYYPNSSVAIENQSMQNVFGNIWNYNFSNTNTLGVYGFDYCDENGNNCSTNTFELTATGFLFDTPQALAVFSLVLILLFLSGGFLFFGEKVERTSVKIFLISLGALFFLLTLGVSLNIITQLMLIGSVLSGTFVSLYRLFLILISGGMIAIVMYLITMAVTAFSKSRGILDDDDDF